MNRQPLNAFLLAHPEDVFLLKTAPLFGIKVTAIAPPEHQTTPPASWNFLGDVQEKLGEDIQTNTGL
ncbi:hypothetical protein G7B40_031125 [Aetokthonos hydrillicola Thurmond2011]|jgi:hypothetical protein|uniref:Uncharacterized protein n=1 Tax=Aetokthonos hydrillicola Thurmond2011 TaxID=2712845 RepID=A0AAP5IFZ2_9CYAN|nr:hypothetical protein [Aetokthonos hydrillicola]MBO3462130.1 hypothetical protein [Aetokthonos hydrillicola CCALA 1050]MBW4589724.1 hypothetical protein [Aetokthonos hydrillicola CCALA 1050]MDR9898978.1 hypothetical protein [Aetokthonos hydrillicola Thurmond2011]